MLINILGLIAASLTTLAFLPQAIKVWKTKSTNDLSPIMFSMLSLGILLWLLYGIAIHDFPIVVANGITICLAGTILFFIIKNKKPKTINHFGIWTSDLERMKLFYSEVFSAEVSEKYENSSKKFTSYFLNFSSGTRIEIMHSPDKLPLETSKGHIAISVGSRENVDKYIKEFSENNINVISMPRTTGDGYYEAVIEDPEGNLIEITV